MSKAQPYAEKREPALPPKPLTANAVADLRALYQQAEGERQRVADKRTDMINQVEQARVNYEKFAAAMRDEIDSAETVLAELDGTADRYRQRLGTAGVVDGDKLVHANAWTSTEAPQTGSFSHPIEPVCQSCGGAMVIDPKLGPIHPYPDGPGYVAAGEHCKRAKSGQPEGAAQ